MEEQSLADEISAAIDASEEEVVEDAADDLDVSSDGSDEDDVSRETEEEVLEDQEVIDEADDPNRIPAPHHWSETDKTFFDKQPPETQEWLLARHKDMEGYLTRRSQEIADIERNYSAMSQDFGEFYEQFAPLKENLNGVAPGQYLTNLVNADIFMNQDPIGGLQKIAEMYGVDLANTDFTQQSDPQIQSVMQELNDLKSQIATKDQAESQARRSTVESEIAQFRDEKDEAGNAAHPFFDEVANQMVFLAKAAQAAGETPKLNDLYDQAVWASPEVREKMIQSQKAAESQRAEKEAKAKAAKAKKAGKTLSSSSGDSGSPALSLRDEISQALG